MYTLTHQDNNSKARSGKISTDHGDIETPMFMPVGTKATVKSLSNQDLLDLDAQIILANTYHLHLQPGEELIDKAGGLHKFMNWNRPILTDSGGFQVFSLGLQKEQKEGSEHTKLAQIDDEGVTFSSHIDGSPRRFTPESAIQIQRKLGADIIMAFDECTPDNADKEYAKEALERTHRWAEQCIAEHKKDTKHHGYQQFLFGIIQGAKHKDLRIESAKAITSMEFDGIAIGGESIGYNMEATAEILDWIYEYLPEDKPRYTMGLGHSPADFFTAVERGIDIFDCVSPTRMARNGTLYVHPDTKKQLGKNNEKSTRRNAYTINIMNSQYKEDFSPIDPNYPTPQLEGITRAYLHHLFKADELLAYKLATMHNLSFLLKLMADMRMAIKEDRFLELKKEWVR